jgi:elongation factor G
VIPGQFIPAVEKGVRQVLTEGAIAGFALQDLRVSVYDGKHHPVDSKEVAFVSAGRKAFIAAIKEASPIVLEPVVRIAINTPAGGHRRRDERSGHTPRTDQRPGHPAQRSRRNLGAGAARGIAGLPVPVEGTDGGEGSYTMGT